jgi:hypothetical protein
MKDERLKTCNDMANPGNYHLAPYRVEGCWRLTFRSAEGDDFLGTFDSEEEGNGRTVYGRPSTANPLKMTVQQRPNKRVAA